MPVFVMAAVNNLRPSLRLRRRYLQTPVRAYRNEAGRRVWLVGLVHHGQRRYFQAIKDVVLALQEQGAAVHYEDTGVTEQQLAAPDITEAEREAFQLSAPAHTQPPVYEAWGWVEQLDGFGGGAPEAGVQRSWPAGWERHDLNGIDIMRLQGVDPVPQRLPPGEASTAGKPSKVARRLALTQAAVEFWLLAHGIRSPKQTDAVILDRRNDVAIEAADAVPGHVVLLWGCSHLTGLQARLETRGYTFVQETWHTVGRLPRRSSIAFWMAVAAAMNLRRLPQTIRQAKADRQNQADRPVADPGTASTAATGGHAGS